MKLHRNAALAPKQRVRLAQRVIEEDWSLGSAAAAAEVSERHGSQVGPPLPRRGRSGRLEVPEQRGAAGQHQRAEGRSYDADHLTGAGQARSARVGDSARLAAKRPRRHRHGQSDDEEESERSHQEEEREHARDERRHRQAAARRTRSAWRVDGQEAEGAPEVIRETSTQRLADALLELVRRETPREPVAAEKTNRVLAFVIRDEERFHVAEDGSRRAEPTYAVAGRSVARFTKPVADEAFQPAGQPFAGLDRPPVRASWCMLRSP
jgi:hypothetical protein